MSLSYQMTKYCTAERISHNSVNLSQGCLFYPPSWRSLGKQQSYPVNFTKSSPRNVWKHVFDRPSQCTAGLRHISLQKKVKSQVQRFCQTTLCFHVGALWVGIPGVSTQWYHWIEWGGCVFSHSVVTGLNTTFCLVWILKLSLTPPPHWHPFWSSLAYL